MIDVDFYLIKENSISEALRFVCRLVDKAYQQKHGIYIHANSAQEASTLDDLIWTFRDAAFIPHNIYNEKAEALPIQIGYNAPPNTHQDLLINLTSETPTYFAQFKRILEIVPNNEKDKKISREKFRIYREKNCKLNTHNLLEQDLRKTM